MKQHVILSILVFSIFYQMGYSQVSGDTLTKSEKIETINSVGEIINENYVFPEISHEIARVLQRKFKNGSYDSIVDPSEFADVLTKDVQSFNGDRHLRVLFEPERILKQKEVVNAEDSIEYHREQLKSLRRNNYGFEELTILEGNIGYLKLTDFADPAYAGETVASTMTFLNNTDAIIIDLRNNGGGTPKMVQLIASYFFEDEPVHLNSFYKRQENITKQFWTLPYVSGNRRPNVLLYVLTNRNTFSAAEEFCYDLKQLNRATIIGETTVGGAHPGGRIEATGKYNVWTPTGRAINPITNTNWEGVGVSPHIEVPADEALITARNMALDSLESVNSK